MYMRRSRGSAYIITLFIMVVITAYAASEMEVAIYADREAQGAAATQDSLYIAEAGLGIVYADLAARDSQGKPLGDFKDVVEQAKGSPRYYPGGTVQQWFMYPKGQDQSQPYSAFTVEAKTLLDPADPNKITNIAFKATGRVPHPSRPGRYVMRTVRALAYAVANYSGSQPPPWNIDNVPAGFKEGLVGTGRIGLTSSATLYFFDSDNPDMGGLKDLHDANSPEWYEPFQWLSNKAEWNLDTPWDRTGSLTGTKTYGLANLKTEPNDTIDGNPDSDLAVAQKRNLPPESGQTREQDAGVWTTYASTGPNDYAIYVKAVSDQTNVCGDFFAPQGYFAFGSEYKKLDAATRANYFDAWSTPYDAAWYAANGKTVPVIDANDLPPADPNYVIKLEKKGFYKSEDLNGDGTVDPNGTEEINFTTAPQWIAQNVAQALDANVYAASNDNATLLYPNFPQLFEDPNDPASALILDDTIINARPAALAYKGNDSGFTSYITLPRGNYYVKRIRLEGTGTFTGKFRFATGSKTSTTLYVYGECDDGDAATAYTGA